MQLFKGAGKYDQLSESSVSFIWSLVFLIKFGMREIIVSLSEIPTYVVSLNKSILLISNLVEVAFQSLVILVLLPWIGIV